ncbi:hypothetical protein HYT57_00555 [Candidatus Woesearchaeota archaeon]|nr:hypothetical protein [Candidatus Woesearchaeota archaeon]
MQIDIKKGFTVYKTEGDCVVACPHAGPALERATSRDDNSETVGSVLWRLLGGKLIIGNLSRGRILGIDFNRDIPNMKTAISMYNTVTNKDDFYEYRKKYAWVAQDEKDYEMRLKIYQSFWAEVESGSTIILMHRQFNRLKSLPGIMDFIELQKNKEDVGRAIDKVNNKYASFFKKVDKSYKQAVLFETERMIANVIKKHNSFDLRLLGKEQNYIFARDLKIATKYCKPYIWDRLRQSMTPRNYLEATKSALENCPYPKVTFQNTFNGEMAHGPRRKMLGMKNKFVIEVEGSHFINLWYPEVAASIIKDFTEILNKK